MNRDNLDFGNGNIASLFRTMFFPTLIAMMFNSLLNICDGMFVDHGVGSEGLAAINIVAPMFLVTTGIGLMFGIGASVIASIRLAEDNVKAARIIMTQAFAAGAVIFGVIITLTALFFRPLLYLAGCSEALEPLATDYLLWLLPGFFFFYIQCAGMMLIRLDGSPKISRLAHGISIGHGHRRSFDSHIHLLRGRRLSGDDIFHQIFHHATVLPTETVGQVIAADPTQCRLYGPDRLCDIRDRARDRQLCVHVAAW